MKALSGIVRNVVLLAIALAVSAQIPALAADSSPNAALQLEDAFTSVAEKAFPAVVVIVNKRVAKRPMYPNLPPEFREWFGIPNRPGPGAMPST